MVPGHEDSTPKSDPEEKQGAHGHSVSLGGQSCFHSLKARETCVGLRWKKAIAREGTLARGRGRGAGFGFQE